jgi:DNA-binding NtrC family response regulator
VIIGEPGVGKTLFAKAIHARSPRKTAVLRSINFSLLNERDQRIALLGGGPPEITTTRRSYLELPITLLLKHVDFASLYLQEKLAEALKTRRFIRIGSDSVRYVLSRPIFLLGSAPRRLLSHGKLAESLFALMHTYQRVFIPPLRDRQTDITLLAQHLLRRLAEWDRIVQTNLGHMVNSRGELKSDLRALLQKQRWDGNVSELQAYMRTLMPLSFQQALVNKETIALSRLLLSIEEGNDASLHESLSHIQRSLIARALRRFDGDKTKTAMMLGISDRTVRRNPAPG